jgi:hypothetical protein
MRSVRALVIVGVLAACNRGDDAVLRRADGSEFSSSGGEVQLADGSHLEFAVTSERYKKWDLAQRGLDRRIAARFGELLRPGSATASTIQRATSYLESEPGARQAIERAGISVRDFVLMTVALDQEMRVASGRDVSRPATPAPMPLPSAAPIDTAQQLPVVPRNAPVDSIVRVDTVFTQPAARDTARKRDTLPTPRPARDTVRDTTRRVPPDTLSRT